MRIMTARQAFSGFLLLGIAGCAAPAHQPVPPPSRPPVSRPATSQTVAPPPSSDWRDFALTPGNWTWQREDRGSVAMFGQMGQPAIFVIRCDLALRRLRLSAALPDTIMPAAGIRMTITTTSASDTLPATVAEKRAGATMRSAMAETDPAASVLDRIAHSQGRFMVRMDGAPPLVVPLAAESARAIEDCRN